jgi:hypothetical protein
MKRSRLFITLLISCVCTLAMSQAPADRWSEAKANEWYAKQPWLVGSNYIPASAINELEMWQAETFDTKTIDKELGWAEGLGMTSCSSIRVGIPIRISGSRTERHTSRRRGT